MQLSFSTSVHPKTPDKTLAVSDLVQGEGPWLRNRGISRMVQKTSMLREVEIGNARAGKILFGRKLTELGSSRGGYQHDFIPATNNPSSDHPGKNSLARHDAVSGLIVDCALFVALLANLGDFNKGRFAKLELYAYRSIDPVYSYGCNIFRKVSETHFKPSGFSLFDTLRCEKAHLPVPCPGVRVALDAVLLYQAHLLDRLLPSTLALAHRNRYDLHLKSQPLISRHSSQPGHRALYFQA